ncbi:MAG: hypothetical protein ACO2ZM_06330 [Francisellaceae bacterium]
MKKPMIVAVRKAGIALLMLMTSIQVSMADAPTSTVTKLFSGWQKTLMTTLTFIEFICGFAGVVLIIMGLFQLRTGHGPQGGGQQAQTKQGFVYLLLGGALLVVGTIAAVIANSSTGGITGNVSSIISGFKITAVTTG